MLTVWQWPLSTKDITCCVHMYTYPACTRLSVSIRYGSRNRLRGRQAAGWTVFTGKNEAHTVNTGQWMNHCTKPALFTWTLPRGNRFLCPGRWLDLRKANKQCHKSSLCTFLFLARRQPPTPFQATHPFNYLIFVQLFLVCWSSGLDGNNSNQGCKKQAVTCLSD